MKIEISNGELIDKVIILEIKFQKIQNQSQIENIDRELKYLHAECSDLLLIEGMKNLYSELVDINNKLWLIEDSIRQKEKQKLFDQEFIELARQVYFTNDRRAQIKKQINVTTKSNFIEEKFYETY